jgi:uncharacterized Zn finger protein (UPF0148 family)
MTDPAPSPQPRPFLCPNCGQPFESSDASDGIVSCPHCGQQVSFAPEEALRSETISDDGPAPPDEPDDGDLSGMKIKQISALRRGAYRTRSWLMIGAISCAVGAAQLVYLAIQARRAGLRLTPLGELLTAILALLLGVYFIRRAVEVHREIQQSRLEEPTTPPDFSTLSDGSQRWTNLEKMADDQREG